MSIYSIKIDAKYCQARKDPFSENVYVRYEKACSGMDGSFHALLIDSAETAHRLRAAVNEAADIYLQNHKK